MIPVILIFILSNLYSQDYEANKYKSNRNSYSAIKSFHQKNLFTILWGMNFSSFLNTNFNEYYKIGFIKSKFNYNTFYLRIDRFSPFILDICNFSSTNTLTDSTIFGKEFYHKGVEISSSFILLPFLSPKSGDMALYPYVGGGIQFGDLIWENNKSVKNIYSPIVKIGITNIISNFSLYTEYKRSVNILNYNYYHFVFGLGYKF